MFDVDIKSTIGEVGVKTTKNTGLTPEYWTERIMERLVQISDNADPLVQAQARAFRDRIANVMYHYITLARREERATIVQVLASNGHKDLAEIIRRL